MVTKIIIDEQPKAIFNLLQKKLFVEQRKWGKGKFFYGLKMVKGRTNPSKTDWRE